MVGLRRMALAQDKEYRGVTLARFQQCLLNFSVQFIRILLDLTPLFFAYCNIFKRSIMIGILNWLLSSPGTFPGNASMNRESSSNASNFSER